MASTVERASARALAMACSAEARSVSASLLENEVKIKAEHSGAQRPLVGRRVIVTRAVKQSGEMTRALETLGAGLTALEGSEEEASAARMEMAGALQGLDAAAGRLCDRISLRHFSHVDMDVRAVAT